MGFFASLFGQKTSPAPRASAAAPVVVVDTAPPRVPSRPQRVRQWLFEHGVLLRPLGSVVYLLPPLVITDRELGELAGRLTQAVRAAG